MFFDVVCFFDEPHEIDFMWFGADVSNPEKLPTWTDSRFEPFFSTLEVGNFPSFKKFPLGN